MRSIYLVLLILMFQGCASLPDKRVEKVMTPEEKQEAYRNARDSRFLWECVAVGGGVLGGLAINGDTNVKLAGSAILPLALLPVAQLANFRTYETDDPEIRTVTDFAVFGALAGAVFAGITYISVATGPVADRGKKDLSVVPVFTLECAVAASSLGVIWHQLTGLFSSEKAGEVKK